MKIKPQDYKILSDYEKLEFIHFAIQEAMNNSSDDESPELKKALFFVEDLREPFLANFH